VIKRTIVRSIVVAWILALILVTPLARADQATESFTVYTDQTEYLVGQTINIYAKADAIDPNETIVITDVVVYDPANVSVAEWHGLSIELTDTTTIVYVGSLVAESEGTYSVSAAATGGFWFLRCICWFICWFVQHPPGYVPPPYHPPPVCRHVVPEVPAGTIMAGVSMIAALFAFMAVPRFRRKQHSDT
jgi:hypothetical protein